jgi:hypothetical protein
MRHDVGNTLKSQDNHEWLGTLPLNPMECDFSTEQRVKSPDDAITDAKILLEVPRELSTIFSLVVVAAIDGTKNIISGAGSHERDDPL